MGRRGRRSKPPRRVAIKRRVFLRPPPPSSARGCPVGRRKKTACSPRFFSPGLPCARPLLLSPTPQSHPVALVFVEGAWEERRGRKPISSLSWVALSSSLSFSLLPPLSFFLPRCFWAASNRGAPFSFSSKPIFHACGSSDGDGGGTPPQPTLRRSVEKEYYYEEGDGGRAASFYVGRPNPCYTFYTFV